MGNLLEAAGWVRVDADEVVKSLLNADQAVGEEVRWAFGETVFRDGEIDRGRLAKIVFSDAVALKRLEGILHPRVRAVWLMAIRDAVARGRSIAVELPLLFEKNLDQYFETTLCVEAPRPLQMERILSRGLRREEAERRIAHQLPLDEKVRMSDHIITNSGSLEFVQTQVTLFSALA